MIENGVDYLVASQNRSGNMKVGKCHIWARYSPETQPVETAKMRVEPRRNIHQPAWNLREKAWSARNPKPQAEHLVERRKSEVEGWQERVEEKRIVQGI
jgi:hypothetical protein